MKTVEKIYEAASRNKLTVMPLKISMRFKVGATEQECERVERFLLEVGRTLQEDPTFSQRNETVRGNLAVHEPSDTMYIVMRNVDKSFSRRFFEQKDDAVRSPVNTGQAMVAHH